MNTKFDLSNNTFRKAFYFVDLLIISIVALFGIFQLCFWLYPTRWILYIFFFQRANVSFLLYRKEKAAFWPVIALLLLSFPFFYFFMMMHLSPLLDVSCPLRWNLIITP